MAKADKSIFDMLEENNQSQQVAAEVATTAEQQAFMEKAGLLEEVHYIGPGNKLIPGFYSSEERAFLPKFKVDNQ